MSVQLILTPSLIKLMIEALPSVRPTVFSKLITEEVSISLLYGVADGKGVKL